MLRRHVLQQLDVNELLLRGYPTRGISCVRARRALAPRPENCDGRPDLAPCGADRFCCGETCCSSGESCCPQIDPSTGAITSYVPGAMVPAVSVIDMPQ